mgnify:CR=1 FL=1
MSYLTNPYRYVEASTTINSDSDLVNDAYLSVNPTGYDTAVGYRIESGHTLVGKTIDAVSFAVYQATGSATTGTCQVYIAQSGGSGATLIESKNNADLPQNTGSTPYLVFTEFSGNTHSLVVNDIIFFQNSGSDTYIRIGRWDNPSGGYNVPSDIWSNNGATSTCYRDSSSSNGIPPPVVGSPAPTYGGKAVGIAVSYT